jgi:hypothetical protein
MGRLAPGIWLALHHIGLYRLTKKRRLPFQRLTHSTNGRFTPISQRSSNLRRFVTSLRHSLYRLLQIFLVALDINQVELPLVFEPVCLNPFGKGLVVVKDLHDVLHIGIGGLRENWTEHNIRVCAFE